MPRNYSAGVRARERVRARTDEEQKGGACAKLIAMDVGEQGAFHSVSLYFAQDKL
jgi:hypothetical protein